MKEKPADIDVGREVVEGTKNAECEEEIVRRDSAATSDNTDSSDTAARSEEKAKSTSASEHTSGIETGSGSTTSAAETSTCVAETDAAEMKSGQLPITSELSSVQTRSASELTSLCVEESNRLAIGIKPASTKDSICALSASLDTSKRAKTLDIRENNSKSRSPSDSEPECSEPKYEPLQNEDSTSSIGNATAAVETTGGTGVLTSTFSRISTVGIKMSNTSENKQFSTSESKFLLSDEYSPESEDRAGNVKKPKKKPVKVYEAEKFPTHMWDLVQKRPCDYTLIRDLESSSVDTSCTDIPSTLSGAESLPVDSGENTSEDIEGNLSSPEQMDIQEDEPANDDTELEKKDDGKPENGN